MPCHAAANNSDSLTPKQEADYAARMFERFFGDASPDTFPSPPPATSTTTQQQQQQPTPGARRGRDVSHPHRVSLEDLYNGKVSKLALQKSVICPQCQGFGGTQVCTSLFSLVFPLAVLSRKLQCRSKPSISAPVDAQG